MKKQYLILFLFLIIQLSALININGINTNYKQEGTNVEQFFDNQIINDEDNVDIIMKDTDNSNNYENESISDDYVSINDNYHKLSDTTVTASSDAFVSRWDTTKINSLSSNSSQVKLPLESSGTYNFTVDWGDNTKVTITAYNQTEVTHTYSLAGEYTLSINGTLNGWCFDDSGDRLKIIEISQWGILNLGNSNNYFSGCENLELIAVDVPDLNGTTSLRGIFSNCINLGSNGNMIIWDVSNVTDMSYMFYSANTFNQPIGIWDVSNVTNFSYMFYRATSFNKPIGNWNTSNAKRMSLMFCFATSFNQPIGEWDTSIVSVMNGMFSEAKSFNQPLANWNTSSATDMSWMFSDADSFNQPIENWDTSSVIEMTGMFFHADSFNQPIGEWDTSSVEFMGLMLWAAKLFNQQIDEWDVSSVTEMQSMFNYARSFNHSIENWNVSNVINMEWMFAHATSFDQSLGKWDISNVINMEHMFGYIALSSENYDQILLGWAQLPLLQQNVEFHAGYSKYSAAAANAREHITTTYGWKILDNGPITNPSVPQSLQAIIDNGQVKLTWHAPIYDGGSIITGYNIYRSTKSGFDYDLLAEVNYTTLTLTYTDITVTNGLNYYYIVKAVNTVGESDASNEAQATLENIVDRNTSGFEICSLITGFFLIVTRTFLKNRNRIEF